MCAVFGQKDWRGHFSALTSACEHLTKKPASLHIPQGSRNGGTIKSHLSAAYSSCNISDPFLELRKKTTLVEHCTHKTKKEETNYEKETFEDTDGSFDSHDEKGTNYPREDGSGKPLPAPSSHGNTLLRAQSIQPWQHADSHPPTTGVCRSWKLLCKEVTQENKGQTGGRLLIQKYFLLDSPLPAVPLCFEAWWIPPSQHPSPARSTGTAEETRFLEISTGAWSCCTPAAPSAGSIAEQARGDHGSGEETSR
ncbi:uncharacterized protein LJ206_010465 isoform 1-T1 [Theristicus caerulescens]